MKTVGEIESRFRELASRFDVPDYLRAFHTTRQHDGSPHFEQAEEEFHFVATERGEELGRRRTSDPEEILYRLPDSVRRHAASMNC
jgi:hypothetical protein